MTKTTNPAQASGIRIWILQSGNQGRELFAISSLQILTKGECTWSITTGRGEGWVIQSQASSGSVIENQTCSDPATFDSNSWRAFVSFLHACCSRACAVLLVILNVTGHPSSSTIISPGKHSPLLTTYCILLFQKLYYLSSNNSQRWWSSEWVIEAIPENCCYLSSSDQLHDTFIQTLMFRWFISSQKKKKKKTRKICLYWDQM